MSEKVVKDIDTCLQDAEDFDFNEWIENSSSRPNILEESRAEVVVKVGEAVRRPNVPWTKGCPGVFDPH
jgi:hypothetical protein